MLSRDRVTPEMREQILLRDTQQWLRRVPMFSARRGLTNSIAGCVAVFLAPNTSGPCWGNLTLDHVHGQNQMGVGKPRATSDRAHLVTLCEGHTERGMRAGFQWNTANRPLLRWYLRSIGDTDS